MNTEQGWASWARHQFKILLSPQLSAPFKSFLRTDVAKVMFPLQYDRLESEKIRKKEGKTPKGYKDKMIHQVPLQEAPQEASQGMLDPRPKDVNSSYIPLSFFPLIKP